MRLWTGTLTCDAPRGIGQLTVLKERWYERYYLWLLSAMFVLGCVGFGYSVDWLLR